MKVVKVQSIEMFALIKFRLSGSLRFLSHAETMKLFQRACVRCGIKVCYSQGFNPRPKLSLPLPRTVGVESDDDLLSLRLEDEHLNELDLEQSASYASKISRQLSAGMPEGLSIVDCKLSKTKLTASSVSYLIAVHNLDENLNDRITDLMASRTLNLPRPINKKKSKLANRKSQIKNVDVRGFLKSVKTDNKTITVECNTGPSGSIRVDEILKLLEVDTEHLSAPIKRIAVQWHDA